MNQYLLATLTIALIALEYLEGITVLALRKRSIELALFAIDLARLLASPVG